MVKINKTFSCGNFAFHLGVSASISWPQLWYVDNDDAGERTWLPLAITCSGFSGSGAKIWGVIVGPVRLHFGWNRWGANSPKETHD